MARTRKLDIAITGDAGDAKRALKDTGDEADRLSRKVGNLGEKFGKTFGKSGAGGIMEKFKGFMLAAAKPTAMSVATGFSSQLVGAVAAGLASGAAKMAHGFAAGLALLPAAAAAAGLAMGTLKLALSGVGDALSGDTEALERLAPSAQSFVREITGMKDQLDGLKQTVQGNFFGQFPEQVSRLGERYLPMMERTLGEVATSMGIAVDESAGFLNLPGTAQSIQFALGDMAAAIGNVTQGTRGLLQAFLPLIVVGASFLPQLTAGFEGATVRLANFMTEAQRSGDLAAFIQGGLDKLKELWETTKQVGRILGNIGAIAEMAFSRLSLSGGGLLDTIERLTGQAKAFFETSKGGEVLNQIMAALGAFASSAMGTLQKIATMLAPFLPQVVAFGTAFNNLKTAILDAIEPAVQVIGGQLLPALTSVMEWLTRNKPVVQGILISLFTIWAVNAGIAAVATIAATWPLILLGIAIAALAALVIVHFDTIKQWISNVFNWVKDNWPLLLAILTGPIGIAVLVITQHWETIKGVVLAAINWIKTNWPLILAVLTGPIGLAVLAISRNWETIKAGATAVKDWIVGAFNAAVSFLTGIPGTITSVLSGMWDGIVSGFKSAINAVIGLWNNFSITFGGYDIPGPGPNIPSFTISTPNIPYLAEGGIVTGPTLAMIGEGGHDEAVIPLDGRHSIGGDTYITEVHVHGSVLSERDLIATINRATSKGIKIARTAVRG